MSPCIDLPYAPELVSRRKISTQLDSHHDLCTPIGGIGAGGLTRGMNGGFTRATLKAGQVDYPDLPEAGFSLWQCPEGGAPTARTLRSAAPEGWRADPSGTARALYPKAWHRYTEGALALTTEQLAPVAPGLAPDTDLPVGVFRAHLSNTGAEPLDAAVMFGFPNLCGWFAGLGPPGHPGGTAGQWAREVPGGVLMGRDTACPGEGDGQMMLAASGGTVTICPAFDPARDAAALWERFAGTGTLAATGPEWRSGGGFSEFPAPRHAAAIASRVTLAPGAEAIVDFVLAWDFPRIGFGQGRVWHRHYTARWGRAGESAQALAAHALDRAEHWSQAIDRFHEDATAALDLPGPAAAMAINELYLLTDGLTVWTAPEDGRPARFGLIECPDYPLYNTLDLWAYADATLDRLFPELARSVALDYAAEAPRDDPEPRRHLRSPARFPRQRAGFLPHDLGAPNADPFHRANDYAYQDSSRWKDLNAMFALSACRAARRGDPEPFLAPVTQAMEALLAFDTDGDGLIENEGFPDQTFDNIPLTGISAYCGGLWLAALRATAALCRLCGTDASRWEALSARAEPAFTEALWSGAQFRIDSAGAFGDAVFAEQLFGPATARMLGLGDVVAPEHARTALATIMERNLTDEGVVAVTSRRVDSTLYAPKGEEGLQWDEALIGCNYSLAAQLRCYGMEDAARDLMSRLAAMQARRGLQFRTPAAVVPGTALYRAQMNLRPLGVFALARQAEF